MNLFIAGILNNLIVMAVGDGDPLLYVLNLGVAGLGLFLFVRGELHSNSEIETVKSQAAQTIKTLEDQNALLWETNRSLMKATNNAAIPALLKSTEVVRETRKTSGQGSGLNTPEMQTLVARLEELVGNGGVE